MKYKNLTLNCKMLKVLIFKILAVNYIIGGFTKWVDCWIRISYLELHKNHLFYIYNCIVAKYIQLTHLPYFEMRVDVIFICIFITKSSSFHLLFILCKHILYIQLSIIYLHLFFLPYRRSFIVLHKLWK